MSPFRIQATQMHNKLQLLDNFFIYSLTAMTSSLLCFSPFLHPLFSCIKVLLVLPDPQIASVLFSSKFLFIVGNLIFIILIGESKIFTSYTTSTSDVRYKSLDNLPPLDKKEEENLETFFKERIITSREGGEGQLQEWVKEKQDAEEELDGEGKLEELIEEKQDAEEKKLEERIEENKDAEEELDSEGKLEEWKEEKRDAEEEEEEELDGKGLGSPVEKLNKRVDDFIARVQKRRSLELLACTCEERESGFGEPHTKRIEIKATNR